MIEQFFDGVDENLFATPEDRLRQENWLTKSLSDANDRVRAGPVMQPFDVSAFRSELAKIDFDGSRSLEELLSWTIDRMQRGIVQVTHPRYFGLFNPAPTLAAEFADRIAAAFNPQLASWTTSPAAVEIEAHVIRAVGRRVGFANNVSGHFTTGGTEANFTALLCALTQSRPEFASAGARSFSGQPTLYVSRECHRAWLKIAHQAGIGRDAVRFIETDGIGRMDVEALVKAIDDDVSAGHIPVMIAATAGTTNAGMIDPLWDCARIASARGLWYHVDAAWGGALVASDGLRHHLAGMECADSVTIDAHKWFATTMGCGMFITSRAHILPSVFRVTADFMPSSLEGADPYTASIQWSRRFLGLRLFLSLATVGWVGYGRHVEKALGLSNLLQKNLQAKGWAMENASSLAVICARPPLGSPSPKEIVDRLMKSGSAWVSTATFEGRMVVRACITNGRTLASDIFFLVEVLERARLQEDRLL